MPATRVKASCELHVRRTPPMRIPRLGSGSCIFTEYRHEEEDTVRIREAHEEPFLFVAQLLCIDDADQTTTAIRHDQNALRDERKGGVFLVLHGLQECSGDQDRHRYPNCQSDTIKDVVVWNENHKARARQAAKQLDGFPW
eukprot:1146579-Prymnesium_polylepis.1